MVIMDESEPKAELSKGHTSPSPVDWSALNSDEDNISQSKTVPTEPDALSAVPDSLSNPSTLSYNDAIAINHTSSKGLEEEPIDTEISSAPISDQALSDTTHQGENTGSQNSTTEKHLHLAPTEHNSPLQTEKPILETNNLGSASMNHSIQDEEFRGSEEENSTHIVSLQLPEVGQAAVTTAKDKAPPTGISKSDESHNLLEVEHNALIDSVKNRQTPETLRYSATTGDSDSFPSNRANQAEGTHSSDVNDTLYTNPLKNEKPLKDEHYANTDQYASIEDTDPWSSEDHMDPAWGVLSASVGIDHTNSFPDAPDLSNRSELKFGELLPQSQAGNVMEEMEHRQESIDHFNADNGSHGMWTTEEANASNEETSFYAGINDTDTIMPATPPDEEAKFEEGLPLVSHEVDVRNTQLNELNESGSPSDISFENNGSEDFFTKLSSPTTAHDFNEHPKTLDRKSTEQVLAAVRSTTNLGAYDTLDESDQEDVSMTKLETDGQNPFEESFEESIIPGENEPDREVNVNLSKEDGTDLAAWEAVLDDDDLLEDEPGVDPSAFFDDDGEGFLEEGDQKLPSELTQGPISSQLSNRYSASQQAPVANITQYSGYGSQSYTPSSYAASPVSLYNRNQSPFAAQPMSQPPALSRAESFSDKSKGGYSSPYDAPMDLSRPKRKPAATYMQASSGQNLPNMPQPPPRSSSIQSASSTSVQGHTNYAPSPVTAYQPVMSSPVTSVASPPMPVIPRLQPKLSSSSFFEELPAVSKPRPSSTNRFAPSAQPGMPSHIASPHMAPPPQMPPPRPQHVPPPPANQGSQSFGLVQAERVMPFSDQVPQNQPPQQAPASTNRYSPAPAPHLQHANTTRYAASGPNPPPRAPSVPHVLPFQPRTSSPLARSASATQQYRPQAHLQDSGVTSEGFPTGARRPSLRATQTTQPTISTGLNVGLSNFNLANRPTAYHHPLQQNQVMTPGVHTFDTTKEMKSNLSDSIPPRSEIELIERPQARPRSNTQDQLSRSIAPSYPVSHSNSIPRRGAHVRGPSIHESMNFVPPVDEHADDPLKRWQGAPIFLFGPSGSIITSFPHRVPRYSAGQVIPMIKCSPGEVKVHSGKLLAIEEHITAFPGPLKSKSKKKEVLVWLQKRIGGFEQQAVQDMPNALPSDALKRRDEKLLLWKLLHILVEMDGALDTNPVAESAVRKLLSPESMSDELADPTLDMGSLLAGDSALGGIPQPESVLDAKPIAALKRLLLRGERERAIWHAVDQKLWGHAMMIASTLSRDTWKQVAQEFVRHGVRATGENSEALAALYDVFAGNWEESVDELVPPSARAGLQMISKSASGGPARNALEGLDRWRETLSLFLSNRSPDDTKSMVALGQLLTTYERVEAAHICFMFSKMPGLFGGPDDPQAAVVLLGANHRQQPFDYAKDFDSIILTEIYEFACGVLSPSASSATTPYLQAFKLYHAEVLAEHGYRDEAQQYCDAIGNSLKSTTKASPYFHPRLFDALEDLSSRLRQSPKDGSGSWISKPSMDKVSGSVWNRFTQFVSGDDTDAASVTSGRLEADGPFARVNGEMPPTISRAPSPGEVLGSYLPNGGHLPNAVPAPPSNSRYAPASTYAPRSSLEHPTPQTNLTFAPSSPPDVYRKPGVGGYQQPANAIFPQGQERHLPTPPTQLKYSPEIPSYGQFDTTALRNNGTEPPASPPLSDRDSSRPVSHHGQTANIREQLLSPNDITQKSQRPSPILDRYSPSYQPRSSHYAPRSASYEPRSASYEPRSATYEPRSYEPSPVGDKPLPRPLDEMESAPYQPSAPANDIEPDPQDKSALSESPSYSYEPPSASFEPPISAISDSDRPYSSYEPQSSSYAPPTYGYEPPSYDPETNGDVSSPVKSPTKRKSFMNLSDDEGDFAAREAALKRAQKAEKDRQADEAFRKAAEADAQRGSRPGPPLNSKSSWLGALFGGGKTKEDTDTGGAPAAKPKAIKAKLGEKSSFYYDSELKKWVNKNAGPEAAGPSAPTPPPPRGPPSRAVSSAGPPGMTRPPAPTPASQLGPPSGRTSGPPSGPQSSMSSRNASPSIGSLTSSTPAGASLVPLPPAAGASGPGPSALPAGLVPPSRPGTGMSGTSTASDIDDLIGAPQARQGGTVRRAKKKKGYVDVMAK